MAPQANDVLVVSTAGAVLHTYVIPTTGAYPHGPTLGPDGNVYFAEIDANKIARITPAGQITEWTDPLANAKPMVTAFGPDGKLYFTENQANKIGVLNTSTGSFTHWSVPTSKAAPLGMAAGPDGNLWFTEQQGNNIGRITTSGSVTEFPVPTLAAGLNKIVAGPDGNLWFSETSASKIGRLSPPSAPQVQVAPAISGVPTAGQTLTANPGSWSGSPAPSFSYQWQQCDSSGLNCLPISGATQSTYQLQAGDVGHQVTVAVSGSNTAGQQTVAATPVGPINPAPTPPVNQTPPSISGTPAAGQTLTANPGSWSGTPAPIYTYQWQQCDSSGQSCFDLGGATSSSYQPTAGDVGHTIGVVVTGTNGSGSANANATPVGPVQAAATAPQNTVAPSITGTATAGQTLTANPGSWSGSPAPSFSYQWQQCDSSGLNCLPISGATQSTYQLQAGDVGHQVTVAVSGSNTAGQQTVAATPVGPINPAPTPPVNQTPPSISGTPAAGQTLTANPGSWSGTPAPIYTYQWQQCDSSGQSCFDLGGATSSSYQPTAGDVGHTIGVVVTGTNGSGSANANATPVGPVQAAATAPQNTVAPSITGTATAGQTLTANPGSWSGSPAPSFSYQWQQCDSSGLNCLPISGATQSTYQLQAGDVGHQVTVAVSGSNTAGQQTVAATPVGPINPAPTPPVNQTPPSISGTPAAGQTLTANPGSWSGTPAPIYTYQWQQCDSSGQSCFDLGGATSSSYQPTAGDVGHTIGVVVTGTNGSGSANANATPVGPINAPAPQGPVLDGFNRTNGALGANWGLMAGGFANFQISGQQAVDPNGSLFAWNFWQLQQFGPNSEAYATMTTTSSDAVRVCARMTSPTTSNRSGYCLHVAGSTWQLIRIDKGASAVLLATSQTTAPGDKLGLTVTGTTLTGWYAPAATGTWTRLLSTTDSTYSTAGYLALEARATHIDDFGGRNIP